MALGVLKKASDMGLNNPRVSVVKGRYRDLVLSLGVFVILLTGLLGYTVYGSNQLQKNTALIATTNSLANNVQQVIKDLFDMQVSYGEDINSPHVKTVLERLDKKVGEINTTLTALETGGSISIDADGHVVSSLPVIQDEKLITSLAQTRQNWTDLEPKIKNYLIVAKDITKDSATPLQIAGEQAKVSTLAINAALQDLTTEAFHTTESQTKQINTVRSIAVAAATLYFIFFITFFIRRLRRSDDDALATQKETAEIMENVNTGLFLLNKDMSIGHQYSAELGNIMGKNTHIAGENLTKLLKNKISDKDIETTEGFVKQLYNPRVKEKLVDDLNPLKKVMLHADDNSASGANRYLDFKFSRVYAGKDIEKILVNVQDVTHQVRLEQRLEHERAQNDLQIEMLTTILNVSPAIINDFISNTKANIVKINDILKVSGSSQAELEDKLVRMYRIMHSLKGEASALKLHSFTSIAQNFEEKLKGLQNQGRLSGNDFLPLTIHLDELLNLSNTIEALGRRINQNASSLNLGTAPISSVEQAPAVANVAKVTPAPTPVAGLNEFYQQFADNIAIRQRKQVQLKASGLNETQLPHQIEHTLKEIIIQLVRNSVVHGIESPEKRVQMGKSAIGNIQLSLLDLAGSYKLTIEDDGAGINYEAVRQKAINMGFNAEDVATWSRQKLTSLLFKSGFSTQDTADEDAGRGVGLDIIKDNVQQLQGTLGVDTKENQYTRFTIKIPKNPNAE